MDFMNVIWALVAFGAMALVLGLALALAAKVFAVHEDERIGKIVDVLPGANCGGCGYAGCSGFAAAVVSGEAKCNGCKAAGADTAAAIAEIMGMEAPEGAVRMRAQVMCSGTHELAKKKYVYEGAPDCNAAAKLGGGDKLCPAGCIGLGSCAAHCPFGAIKVINGVAAVDYEACRGCGVCIDYCPKHLIKLIPYDSAHWVGCSSSDRGPVIRSYCEVGCIGCKLCEKACEFGAIKVGGNIAEIDYTKCTGCDKCVEKCPRNIIWSGKKQASGGVIITRGRQESNG